MYMLVLPHACMCIFVVGVLLSCICVYVCMHVVWWMYSGGLCVCVARNALRHAIRVHGARMGEESHVRRGIQRHPGSLRLLLRPFQLEDARLSTRVLALRRTPQQICQCATEAIIHSLSCCNRLYVVNCSHLRCVLTDCVSISTCNSNTNIVVVV